MNFDGNNRSNMRAGHVGDANDPVGRIVMRLVTVMHDQIEEAEANGYTIEQLALAQAIVAKMILSDPLVQPYKSVRVE